MDCVYTSLKRGSECVYCGDRLRRNYDNLLRRTCPIRRNSREVPCVALGEPIGDVYARGCGDRRLARAAFTCGLHGPCVILQPAPDDYACCERCTDYQATLPESD